MDVIKRASGGVGIEVGSVRGGRGGRGGGDDISNLLYGEARGIYLRVY